MARVAHYLRTSWPYVRQYFMEVLM